MCNLYVAGHILLRLAKPFSNVVSMPGSIMLCTVTVIPVPHQARGHEKALHWLEKTINKILLQADELASNFEN